jgi:hypothetical protein
MGGEAMIEYRIVEDTRRFWIESSINGKTWLTYIAPHVPRFFDTLQDARSWVATIKRGVVYHDAEEPITESYDELVDRLIKPDAPNLARDERKVEARVIAPIYDWGWFKRRIGSVVVLRDTHGNAMRRTLCDNDDAGRAFSSQFIPDLRYSDPR